MKIVKLAAIVTMAAGVLTSAAQAEELRIGTASQGGAFYPIGQGIANLVTKYADGLTMVPIVTAGSVQNPRLVNVGEVDIGITNVNLLVLAREGKAAYKDGKLDLALLGPLHPSILHMVTLKDSPIQGIADLKGKRVAVGPAGGGTLSFLERLLEVHDMTMKDITPSFLSYNDGFAQLGDGNVDAAFALSGYPTSAVTQVSSTHPIKFIPLTDAGFDRMTTKYPFYSRVTLPKAAYKQDADVDVLGVNNVLIAPSGMDADKVHAIVKAIYDHLDEFRAENANAAQIDPSSANKMPVPLHPGAARYFK